MLNNFPFKAIKFEYLKTCGLCNLPKPYVSMLKDVFKGCQLFHRIQICKSCVNDRARFAKKHFLWTACPLCIAYYATEPEKSRPKSIPPQYDFTEEDYSIDKDWSFNPVVSTWKFN